MSFLANLFIGLGGFIVVAVLVWLLVRHVNKEAKEEGFDQQRKPWEK